MRISDWSSDVCSSDLLTLAGLCRVEQRARHAEGQHHAAATEIADIIGRRHRLLARAADAVEHARQRDIIDVVPCRLRIGAELSPAGHATVDELRIVGEQHVGTEPEPLHHAGTEAFRSEEHTSELQSLMRISYAV